MPRPSTTIQTCFAVLACLGLSVHLPGQERLSGGDPHRLELRGGAIDPILLPEASGEASGHLFVLQFHPEQRREHRERLRAAGIEILSFLPAAADVVRLDPAQLEAVSAWPSLRWVGAYRPEWRRAASLGRDLEHGFVGSRKVILLLAGSSAAMKEGLLADLERVGRVERIESVQDGGSTLTVGLDAAALAAVLEHDDCLFVDPQGEPEPDMDQVRIAMGAQAIELAGGYVGAGLRVQVRDIGLAVNHPDFLSPPPLLRAGAGGDQVHGTSVWGILFSSGATLPAARGMIPEAQGVFQAASLTGNRYVETQQMLQAPWRCILESSSIGGPEIVGYTVQAAQVDQIAFELDVCLLQSMGNTGFSDARPEAWAKNVLSIGGYRHFDDASPGNDTWTGISSTGPAQDGRIKPDLIAPADAVLTACALPGYGFCAQDGHQANFGGTSASTAIAAGAAALVLEMWADGLFGNPLTNWDAFDNRPHASLIKALLLNSSSQYGFVGDMDDMTRVNQGWGRPDLARCLARAPKSRWIDESVVLADQQTWTMPVTVAAGETELRVTLVWADPPGNPAAIQARVNDLDLQVVDPSGQVRWGNQGLLLAPTSAVGGSPDAVDTVEQVIVALPQPGVWTIQVRAAELNQDGHLETPALDADFSLVASGVVLPPPPTAGPGQANHASASLALVDAVNAQGQKPKPGINGPFFVQKAVGETVTFEFAGTPDLPLILLAGPLHPANFPFPPAGQLDLGLHGSTIDFSDVVLVIDGITPQSALADLFDTGPSGRRRLGFTIPALAAGTTIGFQGLFYDTTNPLAARLSAATELTVP